MTPRTFLGFIAEIRGFSGGEAKARADAAAEKAGLLERLEPAHRDAVEGLQAPRRHRAGDPARPGRADHGRADRRPRSQPAAPGARADQADGQGQGDHHLDPHPAGGRGGVHARRDHRQGPHRRRRHGRGAAAPHALSPRRRAARRRRATPTRPRPRSRRSPASPRSRSPGSAERQPSRCACSPRPSQAIATAGRRAAAREGIDVEELFVEKGRLDDVFRQITSHDGARRNA